MFVGGAGDERVGRRSAGRAGRRAGLRTGWQAGPSVTHERASRRTGLRSGYTSLFVNLGYDYDHGIAILCL